LPTATSRSLNAAILALAVVQVGVLIYHVASNVAFPYDLNYGEGYVLNDALRLSRGEAIYIDLRRFPMVRSPYPPLFPWLWSTLVPLAGPQFWPGRTLSALALLGLLAVSAWNAWRVRCGLWPVLVAPALIAACPFVYQWAGLARVDLPALLFGAAGVCVAHWVRGWRGVFGAAVLCLLAVSTKQTALTATMAIALAFAVRDWRMGAAFVAAIGVPSALAFVWLNATTGGEFAHHVLEGNATNPFSVPRAAVYIGALLALHVCALAAALWWVARSLRGIAPPIAVYIPLALLGALSVGNQGSSVNYLIEPVVAFALGLPFAWRAAASSAPLIAPFLAATQLALLLHWPNAFGVNYLSNASTPTPGDVAIGEQVDALVRGEPRQVLAEMAGFAVRNDKPVLVQPLDLRAEEVRGRWRSEPLVAALANGTFGLAIVTFNYLPFDVERALMEHFRLETTLASPDGFMYRVYRYQG
jgi:hypothetical protein